MASDDLPVSVGEVLTEELEARGWGQGTLAEILDRPLQFVSEILNDKKQLTRESAAQVGAAIGNSPEFWLTLQDSYYLAKQAQDTQTQDRLSDVRRRSVLHRNYPIAILAQRGLIHSSDPLKQERDICELYGIDELGQKTEFALAARRSNVAEPLSIVQEAWFVAVRNMARQAEVGPYDKAALDELARSLSHRMKSSVPFRDLPSWFSNVGVRLVHVEAFPSSKIDGCAFMLDGTPVIGLSGRGRRLDKVLFTLLHESAHVSLGHHNGEGALIVDDAADRENEKDTTESAADLLAQTWALPDDLGAVPSRVSETWIESVADAADVHPIVIIGQLQHKGQLSWRTSLVKNAPSVSAELATWS